MNKFCNFGGCDRKHDSHGYCGEHAKMYRSNIELRPLRKRMKVSEISEFCTFSGCDRKTKSVNLCGPHYTQLKRGWELRPVKEVRFFCSLEDCENPHSAKGYCVDHYRIYNTFKITAETYQKISWAQENVCAICKKKCSSGMRLAVDHNHKTNEIRGLLCGKCNRGIGMFDDSVELLHFAVEYLNRY